MIAEIDASADPHRWRQFVQLTRMPAFLVPLYVRATMHPIVSRAMHADELRELFERARIDEFSVNCDAECAIVVGLARIH